MIEIDNLSFAYKRSKPAVIQNFSLNLERGKVYGLLGKNGVGKSTLLYLMTGLLTPRSGRVLFEETDVRKRLPVTMQDIFLVPEEFELPPVSLVSFIELNSPFYPKFSKEDMMRYLHYFEMDMDLNLKALSMGLLGVPVFTSGGGPSYVLNPTFGFLLGFVLCAWVIGRMTEGKKPEMKRFLAASVVGSALVYLLGVPWLYLVLTKISGVEMTLLKAIKVGCLVFLPGDALKVFAVSWLASQIVPRLTER